jgi:hypothetical protein
VLNRRPPRITQRSEISSSWAEKKGEKRRGETSRWVISGSRLLSRFPVRLAIEQMSVGSTSTRQSGSPPGRGYAMRGVSLPEMKMILFAILNI